MAQYTQTPTRHSDKKNKTTVLIGIATVTLSLVASCAPKGKSSYVPAYETAIEQADQNSTIETGIESSAANKFTNLQLLFSDIKNADLQNRIEQTYSEQLYFNDTFHTFNNREDITAYLLATADKVIANKTTFEEFAKSDDSYFVRWKMLIEFEIGGKNIKTESIGISQIKFDEQGKVMFHQDFWDNTEGFFRHIPVVGSVLNRALSKL